MLITLTDYTDLAGSQTDESDCREANAYSVSQIIAGPRQTVHGAGRTACTNTLPIGCLLCEKIVRIC